MAVQPHSPFPELGLVLPPAVPPGLLWPAVETADQGGFGSIWVTDRTIAHTPWLEAHTVLGALAARTSTVRIGTSVLSVARRNPVLTAHALATADFLSGGRLLAGVGLGGLEPAEYAIAGVPMARRSALTDEYIELMRRLWREESVDHEGAAYRCSAVGLSPRPAAPIPVWVGGNSPAAHARAGRLGDGWLSVFAGPGDFAAGWRRVRDHASAAGRNPEDLTPAAYAFAAIGTRPGEAEAVLDPAIRSLFGAPLEQFESACLYGTADRWVDTVGRFGEAGARHVNVLLFSADLARDVETIASSVIPRLSTPGALARR
ncbi:LLM class flavin-dependent oxidoreductase [Rhizohabitans arisaemae]|uniref:LLM class flavin-dependent oxidoreductase n=1 Tax=Rhizohabitans arisaemae TaxID=2720610 RepID=UPI0024B25D05|nr:TIGR03619 family F420-dependent LLM class oxidoreductase [Rhizohabitans arisaemae]